MTGFVMMLLASFVCLHAPSRSAKAESWMFRRSYYSHTVPPNAKVNYPIPQSRSAYRRAFVGAGVGYAARGAYRYNRIQLGSGSSLDITIIRQGRFEIGSW